ncbi:MAG: TlpA family protein disulfide reductase [Candidatus Dormibacteraeota bacterium]|uniref:TlpA family protein disulfide reductase n=1 Tax=Candidatus Aeolococcus gillhamiae TaxID=3127015 RepID=A0A934K3S5_9BACT|nr:TlpA family protein disulfide reductase [Candidatus Dormibacteraeota bacterium]
MRLARQLCLVAALAVAGCGSAGGSAATPRVGVHPGDTAPALAGTSLEGHRQSLAALQGSVVVLVFWASWCAPCQAEQPAVNALARQEVARGVHFLGVSVDVNRGAAQAYVARYAVPYDNLIDAQQTVVVDFEVAGPPTTFVVDRTGQVAAELVGELSPDNLRAHIASALSSH